MTQPIEQVDIDDDDEDDDKGESEHLAVSEWLDDEDDSSFQRMKRPPRRMGRSSGSDD